MFIVYFLLFVIFNGKLTLEVAAFGAAFAALLYAFSCKFLGYSFKKDMHMVRGAFAGIGYLCMLVVEIIKANLQVIRMILTPGFEPEPHLIQFHSGLKSEGHRVALADSITLTPGTITCDLQDDVFTVHCLDTTQREGLEDSCFLRALLKMEAKAGMQDQADEQLLGEALNADVQDAAGTGDNGITEADDLTDSDSHDTEAKDNLADAEDEQVRDGSDTEDLQSVDSADDGSLMDENMPETAAQTDEQNVNVEQEEDGEY